MSTTSASTIWVCDCCLFAREGDGDGCDGNGGCEGTPWSSIPDGYHVSCGLFAEEHSCGWTGEPKDFDCDCERREFSWSACEGCGSNLGGSRHAYGLWQDEKVSEPHV